jgi:hypothetical protein
MEDHIRNMIGWAIYSFVAEVEVSSAIHNRWSCCIRPLLMSCSELVEESHQLSVCTLS